VLFVSSRSGSVVGKKRQLRDSVSEETDCEEHSFTAGALCKSNWIKYRLHLCVHCF